jgi:hypothetical protein
MQRLITLRHRSPDGLGVPVAVPAAGGVKSEGAGPRQVTVDEILTAMNNALNGCPDSNPRSLSPFCAPGSPRVDYV